MTNTVRKTRAAETRKKLWTPPDILETPTPPEGVSYRWVRFELAGNSEDPNVYKRMKQGYRVVQRSELGSDAVVDEVREGKYTGVVRTGDLILMAVDTEIKDARNKYYEEQALRMQQAVDQELDRENNPKMPITRESTSRVTKKLKDTEIEFEN